MLKQIYDQWDLPIGALEKIGLAKDGVLQLDNDDLKMLLSGRRTDMLRLEGLELDGSHIDLLDAKLSLRQNAEGDLELKLHPIYAEPVIPPYLTDAEVEKLKKGETVNLEKAGVDEKGDPVDMIVEYDPETNEFVVMDAAKILAPDRVNGEDLTPEQKEKYRKGKVVELQDGTKFQYSATEKQGVRSNKLALIASIVIDGGLSFMVYKGLEALFGEKRNKDMAIRYSKGYYEDLAQMQQQQSRDEEEVEHEISR